MLDVIERRLLDNLQPEIVPVRVMDHDSRGKAKSFPNQTCWIRRMMQNALQQDHIEAVVAVGQLSAVNDGKIDGAVSGPPSGDTNGLARRIHRSEAARFSLIAVANGVEAIAAAHVKYRAVRELTGLQNHIGRTLGRQAAAELIVRCIAVPLVARGVAVKDLNPFLESGWRGHFHGDKSGRGVDSADQDRRAVRAGEESPAGRSERNHSTVLAIP